MSLGDEGEVLPVHQEQVVTCAPRGSSEVLNHDGVEAAIDRKTLRVLSSLLSTLALKSARSQNDGGTARQRVSTR